jgi:DNA polymerase elongation subunit (family B)
LDDYGLEGTNDDYSLVKEIRSLFDEADILVGHNIDRFDTPKAHARMMIHGFDPPSPSKSIDTLKLARHEFSFTSNKLGDVGQVLGIGGKAETGGFALWKGCMAGDPAAWKKMKSYCKSDVDLTVKLYERLRPWAPRHPNLATIADRPNVCPRCLAGGPFQSRGYTHNAVTKSHRWVCNSCKGFFRTRESIKSKASYTI